MTVTLNGEIVTPADLWVATSHPEDTCEYCDRIAQAL